jgi:hypothetical protein
VRDAGWDEYRLRVRSLSGGEMRLEKITLVDALGHPVAPAARRVTLVEATHEIGKRYAAAGLPEPSAQRDSRSFPGYLGPPPFAVGVLLAAVVLQAVDDAHVDSQLKDRHTPLPAAIGPGDSTVVVFFPIVLRPAAIELAYVEGGIERRVTMATREALRRVRDSRAVQVLHRPEPRIPADFARRLADGHVKAQLLVDASGNVNRVDILESSTPALVAEARRTFAQYRYTEGASGRTVEELMLFKRGARAP